MGFYEEIDFKELLRLHKERKLDKEPERPISTDEVDKLINWPWYDVRLKLESALESAADDLIHGSDREQEKAAHKIKVICDLLYPCQKPKRGRPQAATGLNAITALTLYLQRKGSWGVTTKQYKVRANSFDVTTKRHGTRTAVKKRLGAKERMDWREIAKEIIGCKHPGSTTTSSCVACGIKLGRAVSRLRQTLKGIGIKLPDPRFPRTFRELDKEIAKLKRHC
jgi:hypothetical protein